MIATVTALSLCCVLPLDHDLDVTGRKLSRSATDVTGRAATFGPGDRLETMTDRTGATTFHYDGAGRYAGHDNPIGSLSLQRDALGRVTEQETWAPTLDVPFQTKFAYDEEGRLLWLRDRRGKAAEMRYDEAGRLTWLNHGQSTCSAQSIGPTTTYTYDDRDRIESVTHRGPPPATGIDGPVLLSRTYARNAAGEPTRITRQDGHYTRIEYDNAGRVKAERDYDDVDTLLDEVSYLYDLDGNRTQRTSSAGVETYVFESGSRLTQVLLDGVETQRFEYDNNGRVTRILRDGLDQQITWDALDRITRIEDQNFIEEAIDFAYDGQGRRVAADRTNSAQRYVVGPTGNQSLQSPHLVHNGAFLTGELVYGGEHALWRYDGAEPPATRVYLRDAMGSVIGLMDTQGNLLESFEYDAFGNVRNPGGEALPEVSFGGDSRFQGMWKDAGTGLYYVRARYYDARTGRFLSRDPVEGDAFVPETLMPYAFASNNPYVYRDPTGLISLSELNAAQNVQAILQSGSRGAIRALGHGVIDEAKGQVGNLIIDQFEKAFAGFLLGATPAGWTGGAIQTVSAPFPEIFKLGKVFEAQVEGPICSFLRNPSFLHLTVGIRNGGRDAGKPQTNGISCAQRSKVTGAARQAGTSTRGSSFPDLLVSQYVPRDLERRGRKKSALIADIKLSARSIRPSSNQFKAMREHAEHYSYARLMSFITLRGATRTKKIELQKRAGTVWIHFASVFD